MAKGWNIRELRRFWYRSIQNEPHNSKVSHAAVTFSRLTQDYNRGISVLETTKCTSEYVRLRGKGSLNLVFPTVFPQKFDTLIDLIYMSYLGWYDAKFIKKSLSFQNRCVFPLFSRKQKSATWIYSKLLIFSVDQPGLEPGTSRLWVLKNDFSW